MNPSDWQRLQTAEELDQLVDKFMDFHDGCLREMHVWTGDYIDEQFAFHCRGETRVRMLFQRQWKNPSAIELLFGQVVAFSFTPCPPGYVSDIDCAWLFLHEGDIVWSTEAPTDFPAGDWVRARSLWWRDASDWMGPGMRLGSSDGLPLEIVEGAPVDQRAPTMGPSQF